jgi:predicted phage baseplate assembly protein
VNCSCAPAAVPALGQPENRPGRDRIDYRVGTRDRFLAALLALLGDEPALGGLTTRDPDEPIVALIDAWATTLDVLAFYEERIAVEGFLRTATERDSVLHLAHEIGYELRPGVAATTCFAFDTIASPGTPAVFPIPAGTRAQSVPGAGELPQVFETVEAIEARPGWNRLPVQLAAARTPAVGDTVLRLARTDLVLQPGDPLLVVAGGPPCWFDLRRVRQVEIAEAVLDAPTDAEPLVPAHTIVTLDAAITSRPHTNTLAPGVVEVHVLRQGAVLFGHNAPEFKALPLPLRVGELNPYYEPGAALLAESPSVFLGAKAGIRSGTTTVPRVLAGAYANRAPSWADAVAPAGTKTIHLDQAYPRIVAGSWVALERDGAVIARKVADADVVPWSDFGLSGRVTRLVLDGDVAGFSAKNASVWGQSERLAAAPWPLPGDVAAGIDVIDLAWPVEGLAAGRTIILSGTSPDGRPSSEVATIGSVTSGPAPGPRLRLAKKIVGTYRRDGLRVLANAAKATHGESRAEIVGSGDQRVPFQTFTLLQKPLTYARSTAASGSRSTLAVWVNGVRWREVPTLHGAEPDDPVYVVRRADDGTVSITFGDGTTGARLPSGRDNVVATYRIGIGRAADLDPGRITIPLTRPLGLQAVVNAVAAAGADDPEELDRARDNAPLTVRTLGRIVSVDDYRDFARGYAGVGKARADALWDGERQVVALTVAGPGGDAVAAGSPLATDLAAAIDRARHATVPVEVRGYEIRSLVVSGRLVVSSDRRFADVAAAVQAALTDRFSFDRRDFAQPVALTEVVATIHSVPGVVAVLMQELYRDDEPPDLLGVVPAAPARRVGGKTRAAELLLAASGNIELRAGP